MDIAELRQRISQYSSENELMLEKGSMLLKRIIYILGVVWLCYLDHIIGTAGGSVQQAQRNYTGVVIGIIILTAYSIRDFLKWPYFVWGILFFIGKIILMNWGQENVTNIGQFESVLWNVGVYGVVLIRLIYGFLFEKKRPSVNWASFGVWLVMIVAMVICRKEITWTRWFFLFFTCLYLTDFKKKDINNLLIGIVEGVIIGFLLVQGYACMYRPYDMLRYSGMYSNANINALFYLTVYGAVLAKWYQLKLMHKHKLKRLPFILLLGVLISLTFFTMSRTALLGIVFLTLLFLVFQAISQRRHRLVAVALDAVLILAAICISFVPSYYAVRYIPAYVDEPLYFMADAYQMDDKIQKGEDINSEKYISLESVFENSIGRIFWFLSEEEQVKDVTTQIRTWLFPKMQVYAEEFDEDSWDWSEFDEVYVEPGTDMWHPILSEEEFEKHPVKVRTSIYRYYMQYLNWFGKRDGVEEVWISPSYSAPHAHNIFLHIAGEFGIVIGLLFILLIVITYNRIIFGLTEKQQGARYYRFFVTGVFTTVVVVFGMLEMCWCYGQLPFTLLFLAQYVVHKE